MNNHAFRSRPVALLALVLALGASSSALGVANIVVLNNDPAGVGFNDPTVVAPVGGNPGATLGQQRLNAFQAAANIWGATSTSTVTITIRAQWIPLTCTATRAVLGSAGAVSIERDSEGILFASSWHDEALTGKLAGAESDANPEIKASINVNFGQPDCLEGTSFYLGLDNNPGADVDLVSVLFHEFSRGLKFPMVAYDPTKVNDGEGLTGRDADSGNGKNWLQMTNAERASSLNMQKLEWKGPPLSTDPSGGTGFGIPRLTINSPPVIAGNYSVSTAEFGPALSAVGVTGNFVQALDAANAAGPTTTDGCSALTNAAAVSGNIALVDRGTCSFKTKTLNAQNAGAIGVVVVNNVPDAPTTMGDDATIVVPITISTAQVRMSDGDLIKGQLGTGVNGTLMADSANDNFSGRSLLAEGVTASADTTYATIEPGEPNEFGGQASSEVEKTLWYTWTATSDCIVSVDNIGTEAYSPFFAIYMGGSVDTLVNVNVASGIAQLSFPAKAGTRFQIVIGNRTNCCWHGGRVQLTLTTQPFNHAGTLFGPEEPNSHSPASDAFIHASQVTGSELTAINYIRKATIEAGEPNRPFDDISHTVWFKWTAPSNSNVTIDTTGTRVSSHFFAVYVGNSIQTLAAVAGSSSSSTNPTTTTFPAIAGTTYVISAGSRGSFSDGTLVLTLTSAPANTGSLLNLSTRMPVGTGNDVLIGGFIIKNGPKQVVIRAIGPSLAQSGISNTLSDPFLELHDAAGTLISQNNNWQDDSNQAGAIQASGLAPHDPRESAMIVTLQAGSYTAIIRGVNNTTGVALVEVYDTEGSAAPAKAVNVSTRGFVSTGNSVMIAGFIVGGSSPAYVIIRGIGPSLASFGIINVLQNPVLEIYDAGGHRLITIDNWQDVSNYGQVVAAGLAPSDSRECALSAFLDPGAYTAVLRGLNNTTGVGLVEVYNLLP